MELVSKLEADAFLAMHTPTHREELVAEIREAHAEAGKDGPPAAVFTADELESRGFKRSTRGAGIKAGRNGKGDVALVKTLEDGRVLIVLNATTVT